MENISLIDHEKSKKKNKSLKIGNLYMVISPRPIFDNPENNRKTIQCFDWYSKPFVLLENKKDVRVEYLWCKILTSGGIVGWIYCQDWYLKNLK